MTITRDKRGYNSFFIYLYHLSLLLFLGLKRLPFLWNMTSNDLKRVIFGFTYNIPKQFYLMVALKSGCPIPSKNLHKLISLQVNQLHWLTLATVSHDFFGQNLLIGNQHRGENKTPSDKSQRRNLEAAWPSLMPRSASVQITHTYSIISCPRETGINAGPFFLYSAVSVTWINGFNARQNLI